MFAPSKARAFLRQAEFRRIHDKKNKKKLTDYSDIQNSGMWEEEEEEEEEEEPPASTHWSNKKDRAAKKETGATSGFKRTVKAHELRRKLGAAEAPVAAESGVTAAGFDWHAARLPGALFTEEGASDRAGSKWVASGNAYGERKTLPLRCASTAFVAKKVPFLAVIR